MKFVLQYTKHAKKDLEKLSKNEAKRIILKLDFFCSQVSITSFSKSLAGPFEGLHRFRVGDYRIIYHKNEKGKITVLTVVKIKHRKEIYD